MSHLRIHICSFLVLILICSKLFAQEFVFQREVDTIPVFVNGKSIQRPFIGGFFDSKPTFIDIDNDGDFDLFIGEELGKIIFHENTGTAIEPIFTLQTENFNNINVEFSSAPAFADIDNDADFDFFVGKAEGTISFYRNTGTGDNAVFVHVTDNFAGIDVGTGSKPTFVDIDNDSDFDLLIGSENGPVSFYRNTGTPSQHIFTLESDNYVNIVLDSRSTPTLTDIDNDGDFDLFVGEYQGNINFFINTGSGTNPNFELLNENFAEIKVKRNSAPIFVDIDLDGDLDLFVGQFGGTLNFNRNFGTAENAEFMSEPFNLAPIDLGLSSAPAFTDIDGDGDFDLFVGGPGTIILFENTGDRNAPSFTFVTTNFNGIKTDNFNIPAFTDIDNDGDFDLFVGEGEGLVRFFRNIGTAIQPMFSLESIHPASIEVGNHAAPAFVDIDNDGDSDLFIGEDEGGKINYYQNTGLTPNPNFIFVTDNFASIAVGEQSVPFFGDLDQDGDFDLLVGELEGNIHFFRNNGTVTEPNFILVTENFESINAGDFGDKIYPTLVDIDNDGDLDLFFGAWDGGIQFYRNLMQPTLFNENGGGVVDHEGPGRGVAFGDINNDGYLDLYVSNDIDLLIQNFLFLNKQDGTFFDGTSFAGVANLDGGGQGVIFGDVDNDGDLDLYVTNFGAANKLYINNGNEQFDEIGISAGVDDAGSRGRSAAFADLNQDGYLDIYVVNQEDPNRLYINNQNLTFSDTAASAGVNDSGGGQGVCIGDIDVDGDLDIYVSNGVGTNKLFRNNGDLTFENDLSANIDVDGAGFGTAFGDIDNDGDLDLYIANGGNQANRLFRNNGQGVFTEMGVGDEIADTGFGVGVTFGDVDNDGDLDLFLVNGDDQKDRLFLNDGNGQFNRVDTSAGLGENDNGRGAAFGDIDNDGDLDLYVANDGRNKLYINKISNSNKYLHIKTIGTISNRDGIGARVKVVTGALNQIREVNGGSGYLSQNSLPIEFGLGNATIIDSIKVEWPSGIVQVLANVETNSFLTIIEPTAPTAMTNDVSDIKQLSTTLNATVNPNRSSTMVRFEFGQTTSYGGMKTANQSPIGGSNPISVSASLTGLLPGTQYHYRVVAINSVDSTLSADSTFTTDAYPQTIVVSHTDTSFPSFTSPSNYQPTDYRIVGLPGASNTLISQFLAGKQDEDWQVYWDNGLTDKFFIEFDGGDDFRFKVGRSFWLVRKGPFIVNDSVPSAPLNDTLEARIGLHSGWNLITNPFDSKITWSGIQSYNNLSELIYFYEGSFKISSDFEPYIGYYFFNTTNLDTLRVPYALVFSSSQESTPINLLTWKVNIALHTGNSVDELAYFGVSEESLAGLDRQDFRKPRFIWNVPTIFFHRPNWDPEYSSFSTDIRPDFDTMETWGFEVFTPGREYAELAFSGLESVPPHFEIYLIDKRPGNYISLRVDSVYNFTPNNDISNFEVVVGKTDVVAEKLSSVVPSEFTLGQNYPNPFNPSTTIHVAIPVTSDVEIKIYNILGEVVKTLQSGTLEPGKYRFEWDGRNDVWELVSAGIYFYRLTSGRNENLVGKMVLLK